MSDGGDNSLLPSPLGSRPVLVREPSDYRIPQIHRISAEITENELRTGPQLRTKATGHYVAYRITLTSQAHGSRPQCRWDVWKRYTDFERLRSELVAIDRAYGDGAFPGKSMFWNTAASVAKGRMRPLASWLNGVLQHKRGDALKESEGARVALAVDSFLEFSTHSQPPKANERPSDEADTVNHTTNPDLKFVSTIKRADSMHNWKKRSTDKAPKVPRTESLDEPILSDHVIDAEQAK